MLTTCSIWYWLGQNECNWFHHVRLLNNFFPLATVLIAGTVTFDAAMYTVCNSLQIHMYTGDCTEMAIVSPLLGIFSLPITFVLIYMLFNPVRAGYVTWAGRRGYDSDAFVHWRQDVNHEHWRRWEGLSASVSCLTNEMVLCDNTEQ